MWLKYCTTMFSQFLACLLSFTVIMANKLIGDVVSSWPGHVQLISGCPRHPQSQGLVEQAHYTLERMISAKVVECSDPSPPWSQWTPHIVCK